MGGKFLSPAESRYSTTEGEALAVTEALQKFKYFVLGCSELIVIQIINCKIHFEFPFMIKRPILGFHKHDKSLLPPNA